MNVVLFGVYRQSIQTHGVNEYDNQGLSSALLSIQPLFTATYFTLGALVTLFAYFHSIGACCFGEKYGCRRVDDVRWKEGALFLLQIWDLYSDVFFFISCGKKASNNDYRTLDIILLLGSSVFVVIPYIANMVPFSLSFYIYIFLLAYLPLFRTQRAAFSISSNLKEHNTSTYLWFLRNSKLFIICVGITGGTYSTLAFTSSRLFGLNVLSSGLSRADLASFRGIRVLCNVVLEVSSSFSFFLSLSTPYLPFLSFSQNIPQLAFHFLYLYEYGAAAVVLLAFASSCLSISASLLSYFLERQYASQREFLCLSDFFGCDFFSFSLIPPNSRKGKNKCGSGRRDGKRKS